MSNKIHSLSLDTKPKLDLANASVALHTGAIDWFQYFELFRRAQAEQDKLDQIEAKKRQEQAAIDDIDKLLLDAKEAA